MEVLSKSKDLRISNDVFKKICRDLKSEINENKKEIEKLNELDYKYSKKICICHFYWSSSIGRCGYILHKKNK